jgi:hypothetical protein
MPAGLQTFDAAGNIVIDTSTRVGTLLGTVDTGKSNGFVAVPEFSLGTPFWSISGLDSSYTMYAPSIEAGYLDGVYRIRWTFNVSGANYNNTFRITYGVY